ncbi:hypothetical protein QYE76_046512 [Lolium multiflorum]|uniref:Aminotransferase-like plant mobile domain-containing protein n=1 Tax=Lolium multiflorum TaxID=4521 RepID=A0AAD8TPZ9_LOLMU|nr:hypothetical protein QYE76_046512 [Lolium multiflorum]
MWLLPAPPTQPTWLLAELVRPSDVAACGAPPNDATHALVIPKTYCETIPLGLSRFARLDVWRRCHGRHTSMCGADATAPHIHLSVAPAPSPTLLSSFSSSLLLLPNRRRRTPHLRPPPNQPRNHQIYPANSFLLHSSRMVWLLDEEYDRVHRAVHMTEKGTDLQPLKIRYHGTADIPYDERYTEFIRPTGLLPFISLVSGATHEPLGTHRLVDRSGSGGIGGCMLLLSVWSWDRLSVGRPRVLNERPWPHYPHFPDREPTWAYLWDNVSEMTSDPKIMYMQYTAELDTLTAEQVEWEPYGSYYRIGASMTDLNHKCTEEARFWRMRCPLICMWLVEHHQPQRVMRQFGLYQECPPVWQDTDKALHRQRQRKITNWPVHHSGHIAAFQHCLQAARNAGPEQIVPHNFAAFNNYLEWFHENTRIELVKHAYPEEILDDPIQFDEVGQSQHDTFARRGRSTSIASELNFVRKEIEKTAEECEVIWEQSGTDDKPVGPLRYFIKIPEDELILSQGILPKRTSKQAPRQLTS